MAIVIDSDLLTEFEESLNTNNEYLEERTKMNDSSTTLNVNSKIDNAFIGANAMVMSIKEATNQEILNMKMINEEFSDLDNDISSSLEG